MGNLELLSETIEPSEETSELIQAAMDATNKGATLTRSMLTYARRAPLQPQKIRLSDVIRGMDNLISRTIPANIHIETIFKSGLGWINADVAGTESALLNLALNARDAMPDGGELTIATKNIEITKESNEHGLPEGWYVALSVTDTGTGIPQDSISRVFDPFYSTKSAT